MPDEATPVVISRARRVFGSVLLEDRSPDLSSNSASSLCYSPSPKTQRNDERPTTYVQPGGISFTEKENSREVNNEKSSLSAQAHKRTVNQTAQAIKEHLRSQSKRRDLVKTAQEAINAANKSVSASLNATRKARKATFQATSTTVDQIRTKRREEKEEALRFYAEAERNRQELLSLQRELASKFQKAKAKRNETDRLKHYEDITKESEFKSSVYREQQQTLRNEKERRRQASMEARAMLRSNHRQGEEKLRMMKIQEDEALADERYAASQATQRFRKENAESRRRSFQFRGGDARRIRALHKQMEMERQESQRRSYELKFDGDRDVDEYKKKLEEERRQSLAFRGEEAHKQRNVVALVEQQARSQEQKSFELKRAGEQDAQDYKRRIEKERRDSLALRNQYAKTQRDEQAKKDAEALEKKHMSFELKWAGEKDAEAYHRQLEKNRRESLQLRNNKAVEHAKVMDELRTLAFQREHEWHMSMLEDNRDVKAYMAKCREKRRKSLAFRNMEGKRHRDLEEEWRQDEIFQKHKDEELKAGDHRDMEHYKKKCHQRDRNSLRFRGKQKQLQRLEEKRKELQNHEIEQANRKLDDGAWNDVNEYIKECKKRRRMSLALRAKERRRHAAWRKKEAELKIQEQNRDARYRTIDARAKEIAKLEDRAKMAMEALLDIGCPMDRNPFSSLLK